MVDADIVNKHPCYGDGTAKTGRLHLPVASACNIECRFCERKFNFVENRPGVAGGLLKPEDAAAKVKFALRICPEIAVAGIAGPGDPLATNEALRAFQDVHKQFPQLIKCLSTNGLLLSINAAALKDAGVRAITVTVNAIEPEILAKIIRTVTFEGKTYQGIEAATLLIQKQHEGLELVREFASIKINTVLIPGINDKHIPKIAEFAASVRARYYNIIPLLPFGEFKNAKTPTCDDLSAARAEAAKFVNVFYHCKHCRADACGVPGKSEFGDVLYNDATLETFSHG